ncbi:hypothetical protein NCC49_006594 [Naganishia albida]|nr:hypothetical protein NCC49_006594 [Naganishia albida]
MAGSVYIINELLGRDETNPAVSNLLIALPHLLSGTLSHSQQGEIVTIPHTARNQAGRRDGSDTSRVQTARPQVETAQSKKTGSTKAGSKKTEFKGAGSKKAEPREPEKEIQPAVQSKKKESETRNMIQTTLRFEAKPRPKKDDEADDNDDANHNSKNGEKEE